jgi:hypothetical protein
VKRRLLFVVVLLSCAIPVALVVLSGGFLPKPGSDLPGAPGLPESDLEAESRELDRQLQNTDAHRELLDWLSADLIAGRRTLPEATDLLADFSRQRTGEWLRGVGRRYPGRSEKAAAACALVYFTLFCPHDGNSEDEKTARRLAAGYRACSGVPLTLPEPKRGAAVPPCWRDAGLVRDEVGMRTGSTSRRGVPFVSTTLWFRATNSCQISGCIEKCVSIR